MCEASFMLGVGFPFPYLASDIFIYYHLAPEQLMPNFWYTILGTTPLAEGTEIEFTNKDFHVCYHMMRNMEDSGRCAFVVKKTKLVDGVGEIDWHWQERFVMLQGVIDTLGCPCATR
ncbi:hypothetical protein L484_000136 [Morus notabilis]|uniref:Uncharacterized protein n=1 Tax=Morus notabilis TaxID=981085 RepID=W9SQC4_9ROSA|nr:hypothetical protein L484_000136 [Morus notabilis]